MPLIMKEVLPKNGIQQHFRAGFFVAASSSREVTALPFRAQSPGLDSISAVLMPPDFIISFLTNRVPSCTSMLLVLAAI